MRNRILLSGIVIILIAISIVMLFIRYRRDKTDYLDKVKSVTIYSIDTQSGMDYDREKLSEVPATTIDNPKDYFTKITFKDEMTIWKGDRFGIIQMKDGKEIKIRVSNYGQFFSIVGKDGYYTYEKSKK